MSPRAHPTPTKAELEILQALWRKGSATVKEIHTGLGRTTGYTSVLKTLQIMTEKGLVERTISGRAHIYTALISEKQGMGDFLRELVERVFGGSSSQLVLQALGTAKTSRRELEEIRQLLKELEDKK